MAIGLVAIPNTAPAQTQPGEPAGTEIGHVRSNHPALRAITTNKPIPTIVLHAVSYAVLSPDVLDIAKTRVARVYEVIGVRIVWLDGEVSFEQRQDGRLHFSILLLSRDMAEKTISAYRIKDGVLGHAHVSGKRASIFCDRIAATPGALLHFSISLGDIIAHEVGHLLLGANSHSRSGIMRAHANVRALQLQSFDEAQARTITTTLNGDPRQAAR